MQPTALLHGVFFNFYISEAEKAVGAAAKVDPDSFNYAIDGDPVDLKQRQDGTRYLAIDAGVYSNRLHDPHTYTVSDGTNAYTISMSVLTYARSCAIKNKKTESDLGKALYLYNRAAVTAFGE